ncbi:MAG: FTR1 family protein, partial [Anaerolineae bacterium]|nr:FTR1 family protein [Anaerolineae bacterium]
AIAILVGRLVFAAGRQLDIRRFFQVTSVLLILFAAGLLAHGVHELQEARLLPTLVEHVWDVNQIIDENSTLGAFLKALFGYNGNPSLIEVLSYLAYFIAVGVSIRVSGQRQLVSDSAGDRGMTQSA